MKMRGTVRGVLAALGMIGMMLSSLPAKADILIMPIRVAFKDHERTQSLTVMNTSPKAATFRLSFYYQKQTPEGSYVRVDTPLNPEYDISKMIVYSPREIHLPPNGRQSVRLSLRRPPNFPAGEYRVHLKLQRLSSGEKMPPSKNQQGITTQMTVNVGFSIPVIVREGKNDASAKISDFRFEPASADGKTPAMAKFTINRSGHYSTLGKVMVFWTPNGGDEKQVGILNGMNVFAENTKRPVEVPLTENNISGGTFRVIYLGDDADKDIKFDEKVFPAGK
jgi:P pilus assembly chaperone PapD